MDTANDRMGALRAAHRRAVIITGAVIAGVVFMAVIVESMSRGFLPVGDTPRGDITVARYVFFGITILLVFAINIIRGLMLRSSATGDIDAATARLTSVSVVTAGLAEAPAVMGMVLYLGWRQYTDFYVLALIALYLLGRHFPRYSTWESYAREHARSG